MRLCLFGALAYELCGCAAATQFAPLALQATEAIGAGTGSLISNHAAAKSGDQGDDDFERAERCDDLRDAPPAIIEVRSAPKGAAPQWREIMLDESSVEIRWAIDGSDGGDWRPAQNLGAMDFSPPLTLKPASLNYLAYAPAEPQTEDETDQLNGWRAEFDANSGSFRWRDRNYVYGVVSKLPCFPIAPTR
jgi:hypothetical protein